MKSLMLALTLLLATTLLAQQKSPNLQAGSTDALTSRNTVQGCLQGSDHHFTLTDDSGTTYQLEGDAAKLREQWATKFKSVGRQLRVPTRHRLTIRRPQFKCWT